MLDWRTFAPADPATEGWFGAAVAIEGERLVIGEPRREGGGVYVAQRVGGSWQLEQIINAPGTIVDGEFGYSVALERNRLTVSARTQRGVRLSTRTRCHVDTRPNADPGEPRRRPLLSFFLAPSRSHRY